MNAWTRTAHQNRVLRLHILPSCCAYIVPACSLWLILQVCMLTMNLSTKIWNQQPAPAQGMMGSAAAEAEAERSGLGGTQDATPLICKAPQDSAPLQSMERQGSCPVNGSSPISVSSGPMSARSHLTVGGMTLAVLVLLCFPGPEVTDTWEPYSNIACMPSLTRCLPGKIPDRRCLALLASAGRAREALMLLLWPEKGRVGGNAAA